jgi:glycosyltransferase involved in cell wall biosynthesis
MRLAWFSPLPPVRSGVADVSARVLPALERDAAIDRIGVAEAHDFVCAHRRRPYDLVVYQLGNASCHDYMWGYMARYPGLVVLHDPRLHHARARQLLQAGRFDDYRREFWYDHPEAVADVVEYAVAGLGGPIYYQWPMVRTVMRCARLVCVHNARVAADLRDAFPDTPVDTIRLGTPAPSPAPDARVRVRGARGIDPSACVFAAFGKITAEKRIGAIVRAFAALAAEREDVHLMLAGDASEYAALTADLAALPARRVHVTGYLANDAVDDHLAAADACLCLRWPTALESSASWLECLAAGRATLISDLAHLVDVPTIDPRSGRPSHAGAAPIAMRIDLLDEDAALLAAMRTLANDGPARRALGDAGRAWWAAHHTIDAMAGDYRRVIARAAAAPVRDARDLPTHWRDDHTGRVRAILTGFGLDLDIVPPASIQQHAATDDV